MNIDHDNITHQQTPRTGNKACRSSSRPLPFVELATMIAASSDMVRRLLLWAVGRRDTPIPIPPLPPLASWLPLYRLHRTIRGAIGVAIGLPDSELANEIYDEFRQPSEKAVEDIQEALESLSQEERACFAVLATRIPFPPQDRIVKAIIDGHETLEAAADQTEADLFDELIESPPGQFFFRVWLPCWLLYRDFPGRLLCRARHGDDKALDQLLRLDKSVMHDPVIAERIHQAMHGGGKRERDLIVNAIAGRPKENLDARRIKYGLAGMISQLAKLLGTAATATEISRLFDAVERVQNGAQRDRHIPAAEAFAKAIQRNRDWPL